MSSSGTGAAPDGGTLLEKYANIEIEISQAQDETAAVRRQVTEAQEEAVVIREETQALEEQLEQEGREKSRVEAELEKTKQRYKEVVGIERDAANQALQEAQGQLEWIQDTARTQRQDFLTKTGEFRASCKLKCKEAGLGDLSHSILKEFIKQRLQAAEGSATGSEGNGGEADSGEADGGTQDESIAFAKIMADAEAYFKSKEGEETYDEEYAKIKAEHNENETKVQEVSAVLEELRPKHESAMKLYKERETRKAQLEAQQKRIQNDISDIQAQIEDLKEQTDEAEHLASAYKKETKRRKLESRKKNRINGTSPPADSNIPLPLQRYNENPYMKYAVKRRKDNERKTNRAETTDQNNAPGKKITPDRNDRQEQPHHASNDQHPHRGGRVRSSRQFGSPFGFSSPLFAIPGTSSTQADVSSTQADAFETPKRKRPVIDDDDSDGDDICDSDSDSDEENELLSFAGLSKKKPAS